MPNSEFLPLISFIVPVYNVDLYLDDCINSLLTQTRKDFEIILVNDGSTDNSKEKCISFSLKDSRITAINKKNEGLGYARNTGLEVAKGKYIAFIDSDDWVSVSFAETSIKSLVENDADLLEFALIETNNNKQKQVLKPLKINSGIYSKDELLLNILPNFLSDKNNRLANSVCTHIYKRDIIEKNCIRFYNEREIYTEDYLFNLQYLKYVNKLVVINTPLYYYRFNSVSLTKSYRKNYLQLVLLRDSIVKTILKNSYERSDLNNLIDEKFLSISPSFIFNAFKLYGKSSKVDVVEEIKTILFNPEIIRVLRKVRYTNMPVKKWPLFFMMKHKMPVTIFLFLLILHKLQHNNNI